jgi:hypothetical protein
MEALIVLLKSDANAANAFGAMASAAAAFFALVVSGISVGISVWAVKSERRHSQLSVRPLAEVDVADYENSLKIRLCNHGIGPMIIKGVTVSDGKDAKSSVLDWMPELPNDHGWTTFSDDMLGRTLAPGSEIVLIELTEYEGEEEFASYRDLIRPALAPLTVNVEYTDIYNTAMKPTIKKLSWFGRHNAA